jgi:hypothetical protein
MLESIKRLLRRKQSPRPQIARIHRATTPIEAFERAKLAAWVHDPMTQRVLSLVESRRPSLFIGGSGVDVRTEFDVQAVNNRLHQLQGWEMVMSAISVIHIEPETIKALREEYQETGDEDLHE